MTIEQSVKREILSKKDVWSADRTAEHFDVSIRTVRRIWHDFDDTFEFENPTFNEIAYVMKHAEESPIDLKKRELDILEFLHYFEEYDEEAIYILRNYYNS